MPGLWLTSPLPFVVDCCHGNNNVSVCFVMSGYILAGEEWEGRLQCEEPSKNTLEAFCWKCCLWGRWNPCRLSLRCDKGRQEHLASWAKHHDRIQLRKADLSLTGLRGIDLGENPIWWNRHNFKQKYIKSHWILTWVDQNDMHLMPLNSFVLQNFSLNMETYIIPHYLVDTQKYMYHYK